MSPELLSAWGEWELNPSIILGTLLVVAAYLLFTGPWRGRFKDAQPVSRLRKFSFLLGIGFFFFALISPLDHVGDEYLFSAHMVQHELMVMAAPPFILLGVPGWLLRPLARWKVTGWLARLLSNPLVAFAVFNVTFAVWHVPAMYEATLHNEEIHIFEHLLFIATGIINWWPILCPVDELRVLPPIGRIVYLFFDGIPSTLLSAIIVFASNPLYPTYAANAAAAGIDPYLDQQIAGLVMWMPGGMIYLIALSFVFWSWQKQETTSNKQSIK